MQHQRKIAAIFWPACRRRARQVLLALAHARRRGAAGDHHDPPVVQHRHLFRPDGRGRRRSCARKASPTSATCEPPAASPRRR